jgi:hypothetical protein
MPTATHTLSKSDQLAHLREHSPEAAAAYELAVTTDDMPDVDGDLADSMIEVEKIAKSDSLTPAVREQARKASRTLQARYLLRRNPRAAAAWADAQTGTDG